MPNTNLPPPNTVSEEQRQAISSLIDNHPDVNPDELWRLLQLHWHKHDPLRAVVEHLDSVKAADAQAQTYLQERTLTPTQIQAIVDQTPPGKNPTIPINMLPAFMQARLAGVKRRAEQLNRDYPSFGTDLCEYLAVSNGMTPGAIEKLSEKLAKAGLNAPPSGIKWETAEIDLSEDDSHVDPDEAKKPGGMSESPRQSSAELATRLMLVSTFRMAILNLATTITPENAPRVLSQISKMCKSAGDTLLPLGAYTLGAELAAMGPRERRYGPNPLDRETGGVHALRELAANFMHSQRPKQITALYSAALSMEVEHARKWEEIKRIDGEIEAADTTGLTDTQLETLVGQKLDGVIAVDKLHAEIAAIRARAAGLAALVARQAMPSAKKMGANIGRALMGSAPDEFEESQSGIFSDGSN